MRLLSEQAPTTTQDIARKFTCSEAEGIVESYLGFGECVQQLLRHPNTYVHERATGQLALQFADFAFDGICGGDAELLSRHRDMLVLSSGTHDRGKYEDDEVLVFVDSSDDIGPETRDWLTYTHCRLGGDAYRRIRQENSHPALFYPEFVSENHHGHRRIQPMPGPEEYVTYDRQHATAWAYTHIAHVLDKLHAVGLDLARVEYREKREKVPWLSPADVYRIAIPSHHEDPVLDGRVLPLRAFVEDFLGLA